MLLFTRKMRSDSVWNQLTDEQKEIVDGWLFEERLGYAEIVARVEKEFDLKSTVSSLGMYFRRRAADRQGWEMVEALRHKMAREKEEREEREMEELKQQAARKSPGKPPNGQTQPKAGAPENSPGNPAGQ